MPAKFTPRAPQVGRYWPGKPLQEEESSSDEEVEEEEENEAESENHQRQQQLDETPKADSKSTAAARLVTTMKTDLSSRGPYVGPEEESSDSDSDSEEEQPSPPEKRTSRVRVANRRAIGDFVAVDQIDLEEEEEEEVH